MADGAAEPQPSMEEILAMIRRNITDDGRARVARVFGGRARQDIFDLTEAIDDAGNVIHIEPASSSGEGSPPEQAVDAAVAQGAAAAVRDMALPGGSGGRTLEDLVGDMLRPLLQAWLDANLPGLVERLVKAELTQRSLTERGLPGR
ncbi:MAG TPA: DUF2497 domain-containing protein [Stellaceae bacterium]|nr:DUF2497 domain-containing protein [Stellaceae bacterium]